MFCCYCSSSVDIFDKFCRNCGRAVPELPASTPSPPRPSTSRGNLESTTTALPQSCAPSFAEYLKGREARETARRTHFKTSMKVNQPKEVTDIEISIGIARLVKSTLKVKRGLQLPLKVKPNATARTVRERAIEKQRAYGHIEDGDYKLLYPSFILVNKLPGTDVDFTPQGYAAETGRSFKRITLYIVSDGDYEAVSQTGSDDSSSENSTTMDLGEASDSGTSDVVFSPNVDNGTLAQADTVPLSTALPGDNESDGELPDIDVQPDPRSTEVCNPQPRTRRGDNRLSLRRHHASVPLRSLPYVEYVDLLSSSSEDESENQGNDHPRESHDQAPVEDEQQDPRPTLKEIVQQLRQQLLPQERLVHIQRRRLLAHSLRIVQQPAFSVLNSCHVRFSGEEADDWGGPRREYFRLLMHSVVHQMGILEGIPGQMTFTMRLDLLREGRYKVAGMFVRWSIYQGGPGIPVLWPIHYRLLAGRQAMVGRDVRDADLLEMVKVIPDETARKTCEELLCAQTEEEYQEAVWNHDVWLLSIGVGNLVSLTLANREMLISDILMHSTFYRVQPAIDQFTEGLGMVFDLVRIHTEAMESLFVATHQEDLTASRIMDLYTIEWSEPGSNRRELEQDTIYCFEAFLNYCEQSDSEVQLEELLAFWTGAAKIPPGGFDNRLTVAFFTQEAGVDRLPSASTCGLMLCLPRGCTDGDRFKDRMVFILKNTHGFGRV